MIQKKKKEKKRFKQLTLESNLSKNQHRSAVVLRDKHMGNQRQVGEFTWTVNK